MAKKMKHVGIDVNTVTPKDNDILVYEKGNWKTTKMPETDGALSLDELENVDLTNGVGDGYVLSYDSHSSKWVPKAIQANTSGTFDGGTFGNNNDNSGVLDGGGF